MERTKAVITIEDLADGEVNITCEFIPDAKTYGDCSPAQAMAFRVMRHLSGSPDRVLDGDEEE